MKLPRDTWIPGESPRPDDTWLKELDDDLVFTVGVQLFERGQGFEAHEAWERDWHRAKREGDTDVEKLLRALIKLAAAMVKLRQGNAVGVRDHARGARVLLESLAVGELRGLDVPRLVEMAKRVEERPPGVAPVGTALFGRLPRAPL